MASTTLPEPTIGTETERLINRFIPYPDVTERREIVVQAPADVVMDVARTFDLQSIPVIRAVFWLRGKLLGAKAAPPRAATGLVEETLQLGWVKLAERPGREYVAGGATRPWEADVTFRSIPPDQFVAFAEPDLVKIAWTLEAEPVSPSLTLFRHETRVVATDETARAKFRRYWLTFGMGIVLIRLLALPALRRAAEHRARTM